MAVTCAIVDSYNEHQDYPLRAPWLYNANRSDDNPSINGLITWGFALITYVATFRSFGFGPLHEAPLQISEYHSHLPIHLRRSRANHSICVHLFRQGHMVRED